jgi:hypothetical protein
MNPDHAIHQRASWKILTEWKVPLQADYEDLVLDCTSSVCKIVGELRAPTSLLVSIQEALSEAAADAIQRQGHDQPGSYLLVRLLILESSLASLGIVPTLNGFYSCARCGETEPLPGWGFFVVERAAQGSDSNANMQETYGRGSIDLFLYLEGDLDERAD